MKRDGFGAGEVRTKTIPLHIFWIKLYSNLKRQTLTPKKISA